MLKELNAGEQRLMPTEQRSFRSESVFAQNAPRYLRRRAAEYNLWPALGESMKLSEYYRDEIDAALKHYQPLTQFAGPLVAQALADNGLGRLDPHLDCLFIAPDTDADSG